jgi:CheY-like chemotaxis protein
MELKIRPTLVPPLVDTAVESLRPAAEAKQIAVDVVLESPMPALAADGQRLKQVVWNLLSNAIKFTPSGGSVQIHLATVDGELVLSIADTGVGFQPEVASHLFERFRQGDSSSTREHGGLGLGLGIVRHVVELHGGTVTASSAGENTGSTFVVRIPMRVLDAPPVELAPAPPPAPLLHGVTVLVVDDDPQQLTFVRTTLENAGAVVVTASSPKDARARFRRDPPDVLLSDLVLTGDDGLSLIRDLRRFDQESGRATPACALTALARTEDRKRALSAGYQVHVAKPAAASEIIKTVEWLTRARVHDHAQRN